MIDKGGKSEQNPELQAVSSGTIVERFHAIHFWPIRLHCESGEPEMRVDRYDFLQSCVDRICSKQANDACSTWQEETDLLGRGLGTSDHIQYAEFVFFHPFVQKFLYRSEATRASGPMRLLTRNDIKSAEVKLMDNDSGAARSAILLDVNRVHLYLFDTGIAILVTEFSTEKGIDLEDAKDLQDQLRRCYIPYRRSPLGKSDPLYSGQCPSEFRWLDGAKKQLGPNSDFDNFPRSWESVENFKVTPVAAHWAWLLEPMKLATPSAPTGEFSVRYSHIEDERMQTMSLLAFKDPKTLLEGDLTRLAFCDERGSGKQLQYSRSILKDFSTENTYNRFWETSTDSWMNTLYLCSGFAFVEITKADAFLRNHLIHHFRHHYFQMGLIAHFHRASLLVFKERLATAANEHLERKTYDQFRADIQSIHRDLIVFSHEYWFTEISNQMQPRELFAWWSKHLKTQSLYDQVFHEVKESDSFLEARSQEEYVDNTLILTALAGVMITVTLVFVFLGPFFEYREHYSYVFIAGIAISCLAIAFLSVWCSRWLVKKIKWLAGERN